MLDSTATWAELYQVETRALIQAVKRNLDRFPEDFLFQLTTGELTNWRSQFVISNPGAKMGLRRWRQVSFYRSPREKCRLVALGKRIVVTFEDAAA